MDNFIDVFGVRITPKVINFLNCEMGQTYVRVVSVQNVSTKSISVRFYPPSSKNMSLISKTNEKTISAGLSHVCSIRYTMNVEEKEQSRMVITVDGEVHELELNVFPSAPNLLVADQVDFGTVVMANKVISRQLEIVNEGMKVGEFRLIYEGTKPLNIVPYEGFVYPQSSTTVQIEYVTRDVQEICELCQVYFEGQDPFTIKICGEVVKRSLELLDLSTEERKNIQCIQFPHTYYGSDRSEAALLFNNSPEKIQFVAILEEDAVGQEAGSHISMTTSGINPKECTNPLTSLITMFPNQGSLGPYEKVPVLFRFSPRWKSPKQAFKKTLEPPLQQKFAVFIRIQIVGSGMESDRDGEEKEGREDSLAKSQQLEVAITGTAAPVLIEVEPRDLNLGQCLQGESNVQELTIFNKSSSLSCLVDLPRQAHFSIDPKFVRIPPNGQVQLTVTFRPNQIGEFSIKQIIKVLSFVKDPNNPFIEYEEPIHELFFSLSGSCKCLSVDVVSKYCNGIDPLISNTVGICADTNFSELGQKPKSGPIAAYITTNAFASGGNKGCNIFICEDAKKNPYNNRTAMVAFPNDRAASIRPSEQHKEYRTILTRTKRHNYVDPDYAFEEEEMRKGKEHKDIYGTYIRKRHLLKKISMLNKKFESYENELNLGIIPGNKLVPPKLSVTDISNEKKVEDFVGNSALQLLSSKDLKQSDKVMDISKLNTFNAVPSTNVEKKQCSEVLNPQQLHKIVIGPSTINFGDVCIKSTSNKDISVVNNLDQFIHISVLVDCKELRQSSPLSQVIPAKTKSTFPLVFESTKKGKFQRNLSFIINGYYQNHVIVLANVVPNQLHLSTDCLFLISSPIQPPDTGIRSTITITNPLNYATEFLWEPVFHSSGGTAFSIRPKEGVVEAFSKLDCEVVFHPSFLQSSEGDFILRSPGNEENSIEISTKDTSLTENTPSNSLEPRSNIILHCVVMLGNPHVSLQSRRVMFGNIPINLSTSRTAILVNTGSNHAFFRVNPDEIYEKYPGMIISPLKGSVPVGGQSELTIKYLPQSLLKFDLSVKVTIRGWKEIDLKISGAVIIPQVEITQKRLDFGGVCVGSEKMIDMTLINKSQCMALLEFDFSKHKDFSIVENGSVVEDPEINSKENRLYKYEIMMKPLQTLEYKLMFTPKEVAAYDFPLVIRVNQKEINSLGDSRTQLNVSTTKSKTSNAISSENTESRSRNIVNSNMTKEVTATAIRQPISISNNRFSFHFKAKEECQSCFKKLIIFNNMTKSVQVSLRLSASEWKFGSDKSAMKKVSKTKMIPFAFTCDQECYPLSHDINTTLSSQGELIEIQLSFKPEMQGFYSAKIPVYVNEDVSNIFQWIYIQGTLECARLICEPESLVFLPAPLGTELNINFKVIAINFDTATELRVSLPVITTPQSTDPYQPFKYSFLSKNEIRPITSQTHLSEIMIRISFCSDIPINIRSFIVFSTECGVSRSIALNASADNSLLSWQGFISRHQMEYHIVCDEGKTLEGTDISLPGPYSDFGEAQLKLLNKTINSVRIAGSNQSLHSRNSTTVTSSNFEESSVTYEETMSESESAYLSTPIPLREGALNNIGEKNRDDIYKSSNTTSVKIQQKSDFVPLPLRDESNSNTLDIGSSMTLDKESSIQNIENRELSPDNICITHESNVYIDFDIPSGYDSELTMVVQRWFSMHGWPGNIHPINIPVNLRTSLQKRFGHSHTSGKDSTVDNVEHMENTGLKNDNRDFYDMILYLTGRQILGINTTVCLPTNPIERVCHIYIQHVTLIAFIESQGAQLAQIMPEYLMDIQEYEQWHSLGCPGLVNKSDKPVPVNAATFDKISKKAWTTVLLQMLKVFILVKVTYKGFRHALQVLHTKDHIPDVNISPNASNCYSINERIILAWLNYLYDSFRSKIWTGSDKAIGVSRTTPPARWIVNFDNNFMDSLVLATALAAYIPFLGESHFKYMYPNPQNPEQCLHNALKIVNALKDIGIEFDVQAIDIVDPNPIMMLMLSNQLFLNLPLYLPKSEILFTGGLHDHVTKHILISNPTSKPITYECIIFGNDASDFCSPKGIIVNISGKSSVKWPIVFTSRFLRCAEALIMFIGRKTGSITASNLIFTAKSKITSNNPSKVEKISGKCYMLKKISLKISSPYNKVGEFKVKLVENCDNKPSKESEEEHKPTLQRKTSLNKKNSLEPVRPQNKLRAFFCHTQSIMIDESRTGSLELFFLPFHLGVKSCSIIFSHDVIGEFVHYVEATAELPEPIHVSSKSDPHKNEAKSVRVSSADAASRGFEGNDNIIYWKCEVGSTVNEVISIPVNNPYKEQALLTAAQKHLSPQEVSRRNITGTLNSSSLLLTAVQVLTLSSPDPMDLKTKKQNKKTIDTKYSNKGNLLDFEIEINSTSFSAPSSIQITDSLQYSDTDSSKENNTHSITTKTVDIPITFVASSAGVYPCDILLKGPDDVRLFRIECTVTPEGNSAQLYFKAPLQDVLLQNIPIVNKTKQDWPLRATITGTSSAFSGPDFIMAKALTVSQFGLQFKPTKEGKVNAKLILYNEADGTEHLFELFGEGESPLALETLYFECNVGESIKKMLQIPNSTRKKHVFSVESDLDVMMIGSDSVSVLPGRSSPYELTLTPNVSGDFKGILAFVSGKKKIIEYDSDGDELEDVFPIEEDNDPKDEKNAKNGIYRIWYSIFVKVHRGPPQDTFSVQCHCLQTSSIDIPVSNPLSDRQITLQTKIYGPNLVGVNSITISPKSTTVYSLQYTPSRHGCFDARIVFFDDTIGEFWFKINLVSKPPLESIIPMINCALGKWSVVEIPIRNLDLDDKLLLHADISNPECFGIHIQDLEWFDKDRQCLCIPPSSERLLGIRFTPCDVGSNAHECRLTLRSDLLGDWNFQLTGCGLPPLPCDTIGVSAEAGSNMTLLIPFHNPLLETVLVDVKITEKYQSLLNKYKMEAGYADIGESEKDSGVFKLLLKNNKKLKLESKQSFEIPISFAPQEMRKYDAICCVVMKKKTGDAIMSEEDFNNLANSYPRPSTVYDQFSLRWLFPIKGIPEASAPSNVFTTPLVQGPLRVESKERVEVCLWGLPPPVSGEDFISKKSKSAFKKLSDNEILQPLDPMLQEFTTELKVTEPDQDDHMDSKTLNEYVKIILQNESKHVDTGMTLLAYDIIFRPLRKFRLTAQLRVSSTSGGVWLFPIRFVAHECDPDDEIVMEAIGLNKPVSVKFYLTSKTFEPAPFKAFFLKGGDMDFTVSPEHGILPPLESRTSSTQEGLPFIVTWTPKSYSRCKGARLVVETEKMEWVYRFTGVNPQYIIPHSNSMVQSIWSSEMEAEIKKKGLRKKNFIRQNLELTCTAVSSPIKGTSLFPKIA